MKKSQLLKSLVFKVALSLFTVFSLLNTVVDLVNADSCNGGVSCITNPGPQCCGCGEVWCGSKNSCVDQGNFTILCPGCDSVSGVCVTPTPCAGGNAGGCNGGCPNGQSLSCDGQCYPTGTGPSLDACGRCLYSNNPQYNAQPCPCELNGTCPPAPTATATPTPTQVPVSCDCQPGGNKITDACGVCGGGNICTMGMFPPQNLNCKKVPCSSCIGGYKWECCGCDGKFNCGLNGNGCTKKDWCGVCGGTNQNLGCDGVCYPDGVTPPRVDACGVCGGNGVCVSGTPITCVTANTPTPTPTATRTATPTSTVTATATATRTPTFTATVAITTTATNTSTPVNTNSPTFTPTPTNTSVVTLTPTFTATFTPTTSPTSTVVPSLSATPKPVCESRTITPEKGLLDASSAKLKGLLSRYLKELTVAKKNAKKTVALAKSINKKAKILHDEAWATIWTTIPNTLTSCTGATSLCIVTNYSVNFATYSAKTQELAKLHEIVAKEFAGLKTAKGKAKAKHIRSVVVKELKTQTNAITLAPKTSTTCL